jgi:Ca2+-transporting ATPase
LPALAFAFDENMDRKKYAKNESKHIFTNEVKVLIFGIGVLSSLLVFLLYVVLIKTISNMAEVRAIFFVCFSSYILIASFSFRSLYHPISSYKIFANKKLNWSIVIGLGILVLTMSVPFMREIFTLSPLPLYSLPLIAGWLILNVCLVEGAKYILRKKEHIASVFNSFKILVAGK